MVISALVAISPIVKPIWLNEPTPPVTSVPYLARIALNSVAVGLVLPSSGVSSAFTKSLLSHFGPREVARKSVLQGVEQAQDLTLSSRFRVCAALRIFSASGGVKLSTTAPFGPAALTSLMAMPLALVIGTLSVKSWIGMFLLAAMAFGPAAMYWVPGTFDWSKATLVAPWAMTYWTAPSLE